MTVCPNCNYQRTVNDVSPDYECPKCGIIYSKYKKPNVAPVGEKTNGAISAAKISEKRPLISAGLIAVIFMALILGYYAYPGFIKNNPANPKSSDQRISEQAEINLSSASNSRTTYPSGTVNGYEIDTETLKKYLYIDNLSVLDAQYYQPDLTDFFERTGIRFVMPGETVSFGKYRCEPPDKNDLSTYVSETIYLLSGYPVSFLKKGNVRFIMFCSHLFEGSIQPGGIPNGISGVLVMDTAYTSSISAYCGNFHHELYHMIDYAEDRTFADTKWAHLNATDFTYGKHGKYHRNASRDAGSGINGFITEYAMAAVEEDKAEIFRFLMDDRGTIDAYAQRDPVLEEKIDALKERLVRFCPDMNNL